MNIIFLLQTVHLHRRGRASERRPAQPRHPHLPHAHGQVPAGEQHPLPGEVHARAHPRSDHVHSVETTVHQARCEENKLVKDI